MVIAIALVRLLQILVSDRVTLAAENLTLRQQLATLHRQSSKPKLRNRDREFWVLLLRWFRDWRLWLVIVKPATVIA